MVSSANSVMVKTPVIESEAMSVDSGVLDRVRIPMSDEAVDDTIKRSWRFGAKSRSRSNVWWGAFSEPKGSTGSLILWKAKDLVPGSRVMMWYIEAGGEPFVVWIASQRLFSSHVIEDTDSC